MLYFDGAGSSSDFVRANKKNAEDHLPIPTQLLAYWSFDTSYGDAYLMIKVPALPLSSFVNLSEVYMVAQGHLRWAHDLFIESSTIFLRYKEAIQKLFEEMLEWN